MKEEIQYRYRVAWMQAHRTDPETGEHICDRKAGVTNVTFSAPPDLAGHTLKDCRRNAVKHKAGISYVDSEIVLEDRTEYQANEMSEEARRELQFDVVDREPQSGHARKIEGANPRVLRSLRLHVLRGRPAGGFVTACLENDLSGAVGRADMDMRRQLPAVVGYILNSMPSRAHGDPETVKEWQKSGGILGQDLSEKEIRRTAERL